MGRYEPTEAELEAMRLEGELHPTETEEVTARRLFREALPVATLGILSLARNSTNDRVRFDACKYVVERNLGKVGDDPAYASDDVLRSIVDDIEASMREMS
jgi:hypothetical protein